MTEAFVTSNPGAIIKYFFFVCDNDNDPGYLKAAELTSRAQRVFGLQEEMPINPETGFRKHLRNAQCGNELVWTKTHEAEAVILGVGCTPSVDTAAMIWQQALAKLQKLTIEFTCPPEVLQGEVLTLVGIGEDNTLVQSAEATLSVRLSLSAQAPWGDIRGSDTRGPFLIAIKSGYEREAERFISWELFGYALYSLTKGIAEWKEYLANEAALKQQVKIAGELAHNTAAETDSNHPVHDFHTHLSRLLEISRNVDEAVRVVSKTSVSIKKNRTNLQQALRAAFSNGLIAAMQNDLLEYEGILSAEVTLLREQWAELDRLTRQSLGEMQLESSRRTETLLAAAHLVEFFIVFYYALGTWAHVVGEHEVEKIAWYWKLIWGGAISSGMVFATYRALVKGHHIQALVISMIVLVIGVALAALLHWGAVH